MAGTALSTCAAPPNIEEEPAAVVVKTKTPEATFAANDEVEVEIVEETAQERAGPLGRGWVYGTIGKLQDVRPIIIDDEVAAIDVVFAVNDRPYVARAVSENGLFESTWNLDEFIHAMETSGYEGHYPVWVNFFVEEIEEVHYLNWFNFKTHDDYNSLLDRRRGGMFEPRRFAGSTSGPILPPVPEVDGSKYAHTARVQERINYLLGECGDVEPDWSEDSQLSILVKYRNIRDEGWERNRFKNKELIWANLTNTWIPYLGDNFTPYGGYCDGEIPIDMIPEDEVEGYQFVEPGDENIVLVEPMSEPDHGDYKMYLLP